MTKNCSTTDYGFGEIFSGENTRNTIEKIESLYHSYEANLTGNKFILRTNSTAPIPFKWGTELDVSKKLQMGHYNINGGY